MKIDAEKLLRDFRKELKVGDYVRHKADGAVATVERIRCNGPFDAYCKFDDGTSPVYVRNLLPTWWPWPVVVKSLEVD